MYMRYIDLHFPSLSGFFASFWCRSNVGQCRSKTNLSQKSKNFLRVPFSALPSFLPSFRAFLHFFVTVGDGHFHTFYIEKIFTFFLAYVKYTYECHRLSLPSFSGFFALFLWRSVTVDQIITTCHPYAGSELKIGSIILSLLAILALAIRVVKHRSGLCRLGRTPCRLWSRLFAALQENPRIFVHRGTPLLWNGLNGIRWLFAAALRVAAFGGSGRFFILV